MEKHISLGKHGFGCRQRLGLAFERIKFVIGIFGYLKVIVFLAVQVELVEIVLVCLRARRINRQRQYKRGQQEKHKQGSRFLHISIVQSLQIGVK